MAERQLATIRVVKKLIPIEGADNIELAIVDGWQCVVAKGVHCKGDLAVYFEIDSFLNAKDKRFESFRPRFSKWGDKEGLRVKTIKLRKQLSQGLIMPLAVFPEIKNPTEGQDVTDILKIEKYEPIATVVQRGDGKRGNWFQNLFSKWFGAKKSFPSFIPKTDQPRIQNYVNLVPHLLDQKFEATVKLDGSSMTIFAINARSKYYEAAEKLIQDQLGFFDKLKAKYAAFKDRKLPKKTIFGVCSRNYLLLDNDGSLFNQVASEPNNFGNHPYLEGKTSIKYDLIHSVNSSTSYPAIAIQGELVAPSIQKNYEKVTKPEFYAFDVFDIERQTYFDPDLRMAFVTKVNRVPHVPILGVKTLRDMVGLPFHFDAEDKDASNAIVDKILQFAEGNGMNRGVSREGVVFKPLNGDHSFKAISNKYLLKEE